MTPAEKVALVRRLRNSSEWLGDDNIGSTKRKEYEKKQKESFRALVDLLCRHEWRNLNLRGAVQIFECNVCKTRRLGEEMTDKRIYQAKGEL